MILTRAGSIILLILRIAIGWLLAYDGYQKFIDPTWSIGPVFSNATIFPEFFAKLSTEPILSILNQWYPLIIIVAGIMVILGLWMRFGIWALIILFFLQYLAGLDFPMTAQGGYIVDKYLIYVLVLLTLEIIEADQYWGLGANVRVNR
jgi:uncharacterized membrane protein YphA (DoxX/SURF4 family)